MGINYTHQPHIGYCVLSTLHKYVDVYHTIIDDLQPPTHIRNTFLKLFSRVFLSVVLHQSFCAAVGGYTQWTDVATCSTLINELKCDEKAITTQHPYIQCAQNWPKGEKISLWCTNSLRILPSACTAYEAFNLNFIATNKTRQQQLQFIQAGSEELFCICLFN